MSRIGRMPITVPAGVEVSVAAGNVVTVKGPKGTLTQTLHPAMVHRGGGLRRSTSSAPLTPKSTAASTASPAPCCTT